jgi:hypothetical protein
VYEIRDIPGYEGRYKIDTDGIVWSYLTGGTGRSIKLKKRISIMAPDGYYRMSLRKENKTKLWLLHRLVAITFIPKVENKMFVNHKNGIRSDNKIENPEWCTRAENNLHAFRVLKREPVGKGNFGKLSCRSKIVKQYTLNGEYMNTYYGTLEASRETGIGEDAIQYCCLGKGKTSGGYKWRYENEVC